MCTNTAMLPSSAKNMSQSGRSSLRGRQISSGLAMTILPQAERLTGAELTELCDTELAERKSCASPCRNYVDSPNALIIRPPSWKSIATDLASSTFVGLQSAQRAIQFTDGQISQRTRAGRISRARENAGYPSILGWNELLGQRRII
jgi:hypothetical protein